MAESSELGEYLFLECVALFLQVAEGGADEDAKGLACLGHRSPLWAKGKRLNLRTAYGHRFKLAVPVSEGESLPYLAGEDDTRAGAFCATLSWRCHEILRPEFILSGVEGASE
jgi:hypothetical protein